MSKSISSSAALPITYVVLRILIVVNWLGGVAILALLFVLPNEQWIMSAFKLSPSPEAERLVMGLRAIAVLGLVAVPINHVILKRLLAIVADGSRGRPIRCRERVPFAGDRLGAARAADSQPRHRRDRQSRFHSGASARYRRRLFNQRLARRTPHVPAGPRVRGRHAHA